jgi:hypothetical protein
MLPDLCIPGVAFSHNCLRILGLSAGESMKTSIIGALLAASSFCDASRALDVAAPADSVSFGTTVKFLPNGNFVVVDPFAGPVHFAGAVHLYRPDGSLISTIRGDQQNDKIGETGIAVLDDGNFVVPSPSWHQQVAADAGAVTWIDAERGASGVVSSANSLIGTGFVVAPAVQALGGGDYAFVSQTWSDDAAIPEKGAVCRETGGAPLTGRLTAANAVVGDRARMGSSFGFVPLANGNLVVVNSAWATGDGRFFGAAAFFARGARLAGTLSAANALVGSHDGDGVALQVFALANGNYVVANPSWSRGELSNVGAVTWGDGTSGVHGVIDEQNSMIGHGAGESVGSRLAPLTNGNYVFAAPYWRDRNGAGVGAVTWADGSRATAGEVTSANSLTGSRDRDCEDVLISPLANGNYVVASSAWSNGDSSHAGAVTWADGAHATAGVISASNSVVGTEAYEAVGVVTPLTNGNYVVAVGNYDDGRGAAQWFDGRLPTSGMFSGAHAITGTTPGDYVGAVLALTDGNYVVDSSTWSDGAKSQVGAVTWADGTRATATAVSAANSLIGSNAGDLVGGCSTQTFCPRVTALPRGAYIVWSPLWSNGASAYVGAATWMAGHGTATGTPSVQNSLIGSAANEVFGYDWPTLYADGVLVTRSFIADGDGAVVGVVMPRRPGNTMNGVVGRGPDDVFGRAPYTAYEMTYDYDPRSGRFVVGDPGANAVTLEKIAAAPSTRPGHSRHARPWRPHR